MLFCSDVLLPFSHIPCCIHAKTPDFPRLFEPRDIQSDELRRRSEQTYFLVNMYNHDITKTQ